MFEIFTHYRRTFDFEGGISGSGGSALALDSGDAVRFLIYDGANNIIDLDSRQAATPNGSSVTILSSPGQTARYRVRIAQQDIPATIPKGAYDAEISIFDASSTLPVLPRKSVELGVVHIVDALGGVLGFGPNALEVAFELPAVVMAAAGTSIEPQAGLTTPAATMTATGLLTPGFAGSSAATTPAATTATTGTYALVAISTGTSAVTTPAVTTSAAGTFTVPIYTGSSAATLPATTTASTGAFAPPIFTGASAATTPATTASTTGYHPLEDDSVAFFDFSDVSTLDASSDGDPIGSATDQSSAGNDALQLTTSKKPIYKTGIQNGLSIARFDGSDDHLFFGQTDQTGTNTSVTANKLVDSGASFDTDNIVAGDRVLNTSDATSAIVTAIDSASTLSLDSDIFTATPKNYTVERIGDTASLENNDFTVFVVVSRDVIGTQHDFLAVQEQIRAGADDLSGFAFDFKSNNRVRMFPGIESTSTFGASQFFLVTYRKSGTSGKIRVDGTEVASGAVTDPPDYSTVTTKRSLMGAAWDNNGGSTQILVPLDGDIGQVVIHDTAKSDGDMDLCEQSLAAKWGITLP